MRRRLVGVLSGLLILVASIGPVHAGEIPTVAEAKAFAREILGPREYRCLDRLARRESGWNPHALNRWSGAYGIPQAVPGAKMRSAGRDWRDNPVTQTRWMIRYVKVRYGGACNAYSHALAVGWY